jgi:hypothetical protein
MLTTILAYIIGFLGLVMIAVGIWGLFVEGTDYGIIGVICFGFGMVGIAQALRLLLVLVRR